MEIVLAGGMLLWQDRSRPALSLAVVAPPCRAPRARSDRESIGSAPPSHRMIIAVWPEQDSPASELRSPIMENSPQ